MAKKENPQTDIKQINRLSSLNIPALWIDKIDLAMRGDDICLLRLSTEFPEGIIEQSRAFVSRKLLENFLTGLASTLDFYPEPPDKKKE
jgi:hypothetical protein